MLVNKNKNGSVMIAALIVALITGSLVGLFLSTVSQEVKYAHQSRMAFQAVNLAEAGLEHAIYSLHNKNWTGWTKGGKGYYRSSFPNVSYSFRGESRQIKAYIEPNNSPPRIISEGIIRIPGGHAITKQVLIELGSKSSLFANGLVAKDSVVFNGNGNSVDSYSSSKGKYDPEFNRNDQGTVASVSISPGIFDVGNSDIFGFAATGGGALSDTKANPPDVGPNGTIKGKNTPDGINIDPDRVATDFYAVFPDPIAPAMPSAILTAPDTQKNPVTIGTPGLTTRYKISDLNVNDVLTIQGTVIFLVEGDVTIKGEIQLDAGDTTSQIEIHSTGSVDIGGNGIINPTEKPEKVFIYGLGKDPTKPPEIKLHGNGALAAVVYAPNYDITLGGGGNSGVMMGAAVGQTVTFGGSYEFHYDEDLADFGSPDAPAKVTRWVELTEADERKNMDTILTDGL